MKKIVSIIVPVYNEEDRIVNFLEDLLKFAKSNLKNYELIFVDDGSVDKTLEIIKGEVKNNKNVKIISYRPNIGKGFAVKKGVFATNGELILFIDADGSIRVNQIRKMLEKLEHYDIVVGDRSCKESDVKQPFLRKIIGIVFNMYVDMLFNSEIRDNLCGFKGFHKEVARELFKDLIVERWLFDVELFYKIKKKNYSLYQLPIEWEHREGSKIKLIDPLKMIFQLIVLRIKLIGF